MARNTWLGDAPAVAQVQTFAFAGTWEADDKVKVDFKMPDGSIANTYTFTGGSTTIATIIDAIVTAWLALDASAYPEFAEITPSRSSTTLVLTAVTAGVPFTVTLTPLESGGGGADSQTVEGGTSATTGTTSTASSGPNDWSVAANWSLRAVPVNSDDVDLIDSTIDILYGLAQSSVTLTSLNIHASYTGRVGLKWVTSTSYIEYRPLELAIGATTVNIGQGPGGGSSRLKIDTGSGQTTINVYLTGQAEDSGVKAVQWRGTHASNVVNILSGSFAAAQYPEHSATIATARIGAGTSSGSNPGVAGGGNVDVFFGSGCTLTTVDKSAGNLEANSGATTVTNTGGDLVWNAGSITTLNAWSGRATYNGTGTIATAKIGPTGTLDLSANMRAMTVTNPVQIYAGGTYLNPHRRGGLTYQAIGCPITAVNVDFGFNVQSVITAI